MSWCHRFEIISNNGSVLESIENYNLLSNLLHTATSPDDYRNTAGKLIDNQGSKAERNANMAHPTGKMYCTGLDASGILGGNSKYLPCQFIQGSLTMEFHLASFDECFTQSGTRRGKYTITEVEYVAECLQFGQDFNMVFEQQLRTSGVDIAYHTYRSHTQSLISGDDQTIQISQNSKSVKGCYCVMRDKNKYRDYRYDSLSTYKSGNLQDFQFDLGGRLFPEGRLKCQGNAYGNAYASNLNSFNHFRDQGGGSEIDRKTFSASQTETIHPRSGTGTGLKCNSTKRMYGKLASGVLYSSYAIDVTKQTDNRHLQCFGTIFQPDDLDDISDFKLGERYKVSTLNSVNSTAVGADQTVQSDSDYHKNTEITLGDPSDTTNDAYLYVVGYGDVVVAHTQVSGTSIETKGYINLTGCVHFSSKAKDDTTGLLVKKGGPMQASPYAGIADITGAAAGQKKFGSGAAKGGGSVVDVATGATAAKLSASVAGSPLAICQDVVVKDVQFNYKDGDKSRFFWHSCVLDQVPDDSKFYIGMNFETHNEHESMVSGTDLTNTVPLHLNLKFSGSNNIQEKVNTGDVITSFIHYDCILRIEPDGNTVSSA
jgi:hypothetical protein